MIKDAENPEVKEDLPPRKYRLTFKQNRSFELTVQGTTFFFGPHQALHVDEWVIAKMTDQEKQFFVVEAINAD